MKIKKLPNADQLISLAQSGDRDAEEQLLTAYFGIVKSVVFSFYVVCADIDKDDLLQAGLIGLMRAVRTFALGGGASFETYAARCVKNAVIDELRHASETLPIDEDYEAPSDDQLKELAEAIAIVLSPEERQVLELRLDSMSYSEISSQLGIQKKKVDNLIMSAKKKLKNFMQ